MTEETKEVEQKYECVEEFDVEKCDENECGTDEWITISIGGIWHISYEDANEVRLTNEESYGWVNINRDEFNELFKPIK